MRTLLCAALLAALAAPARADVKLPTIFTSHMVIQRDKPIIIWGWAEKGEKVSATFGEATASATADDDGNFSIKLPASKANDKGQALTIKGKNTVNIEDVLVGDVWVGSGQSNMEWSVNASADPTKTRDGADHPTIRLYQVPKVQAKAPTKDIKAAWSLCTPKTIGGFSAALYHFGVSVQKDQKVPIGLINSSWGGSPIEPWTVTEKTSGGMYNAMIAPISQFAVKGVTWYQGESNMGQGMAYVGKKEALIKGWRKFWGDDMPFYFVQIAPFSGYGGDAEALPKFWEAQTACLKIPGTGMIVITDAVHAVGDIHPKDKLTVGNRLALWALAKTYGKKDVLYSGPLFKSAKFDGGKAVVAFAHGAGLKSRDDKDLTTFEIAGDDGKWYKAEAKIDGETVIVWSKEVEKPANVRFGWTKTTNPNLCNKDGLPAGPFRSKDWKGGTGE